ncbi:DNA topoisomerase III [Neobacillus sp. D3-1R]|uniref:DNA topoisomerase III n=1 Tax=Neobacillus sp. D3-1R TaxID=3445778 RepID=UPI003F9EFA2D
MKSLILAEKPSVARELARVLGCKQQSKSYIEGSQYIVTWALGHLVELKMPEQYDTKYKTWNLEDLPIIPERMGLNIMKQTHHQFRAIESLAKRNDIKEIIIATDAGREGELVARWILEKIKWRKPLKRLWISSYTDKAIKDGFKQLKPGQDFENLYQSAVCRAEADWLIGLNVTRALTTKYNDPLSAGRVQTPTLALILEKESEIQKFVPKEYWTIKVPIGSSEADWEKNGEKRIFDQETVNRVKEQLENSDAIVENIKKNPKKETQPLPYDLTELQRDCNKRFGFSAKKTSTVLQRLYEQYKLVTYPRTDSRYLTTDMEGTMLERLQAISGGYKEETLLPIKNKGKVATKKVFNNEKVTDHHAIIPTEERLRLDVLDSDERKVYDLITRRFLTLFYPEYEYETTQITLKAGQEQLVLRETTIVNLGFKKVLNKENVISEGTKANWNVGKTYTLRSVQVAKGLTEPPSRFTEADLLGKMEKFGLGTPATRADLIERIIETEVVDRQNGKLIPTAKGKQLFELVNDELKSPDLTAKWEKQLELISKGKASPKEFLKNIRQQTEKLVSEIKGSNKSYRAHNLTGSKCPECESFLKERNTKEGKVLVCSNHECSYRRRKDPKLSNRRCPQCHKKMEIHNGKAGAYFQCRPCNLVEKAEAKKKAVSKHEERKLVQKYSAKNEDFGTSLGDLLKAALEDKE